MQFRKVPLLAASVAVFTFTVAQAQRRAATLAAPPTSTQATAPVNTDTPPGENTVAKRVR